MSDHSHNDELSAPADERLRVAELGPDEPRGDARGEAPISPLRPETMPRAEDDAATFERSPEFHDRRERSDE